MGEDSFEPKKPKIRSSEENTYDFASRMEKRERGIPEKPGSPHTAVEESHEKKTELEKHPEQVESKAAQVSDAPIAPELSADYIIGQVLADNRIRGQEMEKAASTALVEHEPFGEPFEIFDVKVLRKKSTRSARAPERQNDSVKARKYPLLDPNAFLEKSDRFKTVNTGGLSQREIAKLLDIAPTQVNIIRRLGNLTSEVRDLLKNKRITVQFGATIAHYPPAIQLMLSRAFLDKKITAGDLQYGFIHRHPHLTLRQRVEMKGVEWPNDLDDAGNPVEAPPSTS